MAILGTITTAVSMGVIGFMWGGPPGAFAGVALGIGLSLVTQRLAPDSQTPGAPQVQELQLPTATEGAPIFDLLGISKFTGNLIHYWGNRREEVTESVEAAKGSKGSGDEYVVGYRFYLSWIMGFCLGPLDMLYTIYANDQVIYDGALACPSSGGKEIISLGQLATDFEEQNNAYTDWYPTNGYTYPKAWVVGDPWAKMSSYYGAQEVNSTICWTWGNEDRTACSLISSHTYQPWNNITEITFVDPCIDPLTGQEPLAGQSCLIRVSFTYQQGSSSDPNSMGNLHFYFGTDDQLAESLAASHVSSGYNIPFRGLCYGFFNDCYIGRYNRMPHIKIVGRKTPSKSFSSKNIINGYDYNPSHAIYHILTDKYHAGLDSNYIESSSFITAANTLFSESLGVSILFNNQNTAKQYIKTVLDHIRGVVTYSSGMDLKDEPGN